MCKGWEQILPNKINNKGTMFKFIQQYAEKIENVAVYPMVSLFIFLIFFVGLVYYVIRMDKKSVQLLSNIPLDNSGEPNNQPL
jgi:hypothetical protein